MFIFSNAWVCSLCREFLFLYNSTWTCLKDDDDFFEEIEYLFYSIHLLLSKNLQFIIKQLNKTIKAYTF